MLFCDHIFTSCHRFVPGTFTIMFFMAVIEKQNFSLWISYLLSGIQMILLLGLLIYYDYIRPRLFKNRVPVEQIPDETSGLITTDAAQSYSNDIAGYKETEKSG
jgi:hypothetical protein